MDNAKVAIILASLENQNLRIKTGLDTSLGSLLALLTFLALFSTLGNITIEIAVLSLISGIILFSNLLYCFSSLKIQSVEIDEKFESKCNELANRKDCIICKSRFLYITGALFMFLAFILSIYSNWS